ncbi:MAG: carbohydrate-binding module family 20 domain-containing protein [Candidatus Eisenbacteria bacterium]
MRLIAAIVIALVIPAYALAGPSIVGSMQGWDPADPAYDLAITGSGVYELTTPLLAGFYEYKVTETDFWDGNDFPGANQSFTLAADGDVIWFVNLGANVGVKEGDEFVFHHMNPPIVAGDMQSELGGADWDAGDTVNSVMFNGLVDGVWEFTAVIAPAGDYQCKVVLNNNWDQDTGANVSFHSDGVNPVTFTYDMSNNTTGVSTQVVTQQDVTVTFTVCLPDSIDSFFDVCITGSHASLTNWGFGILMGQPCPTLQPKLWTVDVMFPAGSDPFVEYKYKKDDCQTWEGTGNRPLTIDDSAPTQTMAPDVWEFLATECPDCSSPVEDTSWGTIKSIFR